MYAFNLYEITKDKEMINSANEHTDSIDTPDDEIETGDPRTVSLELLKEVSKWKLEARAEDNDRYFYHVREVSDILSGEKCYVIGRKGAGKTALSEYFSKMTEHNVFCEKLNFKNFPFNELYSLQNKGYTTPNQYITLWKYVIYNTICKMMFLNENIDMGIRDKLKIYAPDANLSLARKISNWTSGGFNLDLPVIGGIGGSFSKENTTGEQHTWIQKVNLLEDFILKNIDAAKYFILFDELDEDYRDMVEKSQYEHYTSLITSLFKAVQDIKNIFNNAPKTNILPVVFLRDDIYEIIQDSDKNKWNDFKIELFWNEARVKQLIAFRISRAINPTEKNVLPFDVAWSRLMGNNLVGIGTKAKKRISSFDYISKSTYLRPRDFVAYLKACADDAIENNTTITAKTIKKVDKAFSNYLKSELNDELFAVLPDISLIFDTISQIRKWLFTIKEFEQAYLEQIQRNNLSEKNFGYVLQILYIFSVIGNMTRKKTSVFRIYNKEARLNFNEQIVVHRGLLKSLQIW
jgi:Cdc6-like AAA superfamily ATPase